MPILVMIIIAGVVVTLITASDPPPAFAYASRLPIDCKDDPVLEGDSYRLHILNDTFDNHETMKVYWSTEEGTAKESDYSPLHHEGQASNGFQSDEGRMGRTFSTTEDVYSEEDETFTVRADNASSTGTGAGSCEIEIEDDDGPGAIRT